MPTAKTLVDNVTLMRFIERMEDHSNIIGICMGDAGIISRVLGLRAGSAFTFAAATVGEETGPGQIAARTLIETYRIDQVDAATKVYGVAGNPIRSSLSPIMMNTAFRRETVNAVYLGLQAGFLPAEAISVANADEAVDTNAGSEPVSNGKAGRWNVVLHYHFAIEPGAKYVKRNTPTARHGVETATSLGELGEGLHVLQDSYSHEDAYVGNVMDQFNKYGGRVPLWALKIEVKDPEHGIAHPDKPSIGSRADNHFTDQTWTDQDKAVEMAKITFEAMVDYRVRTRAISAYEGNRIKQRWAQIEPSVRVFARARTKAEKERWRGMYAVGVTFTQADLKDMTIDEK